MFIPIVIGALVWALATMKPRPTPGDGHDPIAADVRERADAVEHLLETAGLPSPAVLALLAVSYRESRWLETAANTSEAERAQALEGYDRDPSRWAAPREAFAFGGGGLYGLLPVTALASADADDAPDPRVWVFRPQEATVAAVGYTRFLANAAGPTATVADLIAGWGLPSRLSQPPDASTTFLREASAAELVHRAGLAPSEAAAIHLVRQSVPLASLPTVAAAKAALLGGSP